MPLVWVNLWGRYFEKFGDFQNATILNYGIENLPFLSYYFRCCLEDLLKVFKILEFQKSF